MTIAGKPLCLVTQRSCSGEKQSQVKRTSPAVAGMKSKEYRAWAKPLSYGGVGAGPSVKRFFSRVWTWLPSDTVTLSPLGLHTPAGRMQARPTVCSQLAYCHPTCLRSWCAMKIRWSLYHRCYEGNICCLHHGYTKHVTHGDYLLIGNTCSASKLYDCW